MQKTRKAILNILRESGQATIDQLSAALELTPVTIRHHVEILRNEELIEEPMPIRRQTRGRPQHVYKLTAQAARHYPDSYLKFADITLLEIREQVGAETVDAIMRGVARRMVADLPAAPPDEMVSERLDRAVAFLNQKGYAARWELTPQGHVLHTANCPYQGLAQKNCCEPCVMDLALMTELLGVTPQRIDWIVSGGQMCSYRIPTSDTTD